MHSTQKTGTFDEQTGGDPLLVFASLSGPLAALIERYEAFVKALEGHRAAISKADGRGIDTAIAAETELLDELTDLDIRCRTALGHGQPGTGGWRLTTLAEAIGGDDGARLAESAAYLKALTSRAGTLQRSIREASASMAAHIDGLVRRVSQRLSHSGTYGAAGVVENRAAVVSGLDMSL